MSRTPIGVLVLCPLLEEVVQPLYQVERGYVMSGMSDRSRCLSHGNSSERDAGVGWSGRPIPGRCGHKCGGDSGKTRLLTHEHSAAFPNGFRYVYGAWLVLFLIAVSACPIFAGEEASSVSLKTAITLVGANNDNKSLSIPVQPGQLSVDLYLQVVKGIQGVKEGSLTVTTFVAQTPPEEVVKTAISLVDGSNAVGPDSPVKVQITAPSFIHLRITATKPLRFGTSYKGQLFLTAGGQSHRWEVTLTTGGKGILAVDPIGTMKFASWGTQSVVGSFPVTIYDKSGGGPYEDVRVRFEPTGAAASKAITSNFSLDTFSFYEEKQGSLKRVDLEHRGEDRQQQAQEHKTQTTVRVARGGQRTLKAMVAPLSPGEYAGTLRFVSDQAAGDDKEAKLAVKIQVRHYWPLPVLVILVGSLVGWYGSKYVVAAHKARGLARQVKDLQVRADYLTRLDPSRTGWDFPSEASSYALARVRVMLSHLAQLSSQVLLILFREDWIEKQRSNAERRVSALERLQLVRRRVQPEADSRPAAQLALGRLLRRANDILDRPTFDDARKADFEGLMKTAEQWLAPGTRDKVYREALVGRLKYLELQGITHERTTEGAGPIDEQLNRLLGDCPDEKKILDETKTPKELSEYDRTIAKLDLLWREQKTDWGKSLAEMCGKGKSLEEMYHVVDRNAWKSLEAAEKGQLHIEFDRPGDELKTYDLLEVRLESNVPGLKTSRLIHHPLRVEWRIDPPDHNVRYTETSGLTLAQYFPLPGEVKIDAALSWEGQRIAIPKELSKHVEPNPDYRERKFFWIESTEWMAIVIATGFAVATAMATQYDSTFGSFSQYLTLFLWAAGAGTGGNLFKQLGTASSPGGQPDATLPAAPRG